MRTMGQVLIGFGLLIVVASMVIVAGTVYSSGGPKGLYKQQPEAVKPVPAEATPRP